MAPRKKIAVVPTLIREWTLPAAATLGSSVRAKGILLEIRAKLAPTVKKFLDIRGVVLTLGMVEGSDEAFHKASAIVSKTLDGIERLPVIPREIQDILTISATERHRWLKDGRLHSAGTRTVKLHGRARKITFHVFDPLHVVDVLDRDLLTVWREADAEAAAENRRRAAWNRKLARSQKADVAAEPVDDSDAETGPRPKLQGWAEFERDGPLR